MKREKATRAAFDAAQALRPEGHKEAWDTCQPWVREAYFAAFDAILAELREPDETMRRAGKGYHGPTVTWQAMIDSISGGSDD